MAHNPLVSGLGWLFNLFGLWVSPRANEPPDCAGSLGGRARRGGRRQHPALGVCVSHCPARTTAPHFSVLLLTLSSPRPKVTVEALQRGQSSPLREQKKKREREPSGPTCVGRHQGSGVGKETCVLTASVARGRKFRFKSVMRTSPSPFRGPLSFAGTPFAFRRKACSLHETF